LFSEQQKKRGISDNEFVYLIPRDRNAPEGNPYNLKIVPHSDLDQKNFYTLSLKGVTHFVNGVAGLIHFFLE
jgi:hypothetical protein